MNVTENEEANDQLRHGQLVDQLANETELSSDFVSRCLDGDMDALAQLDERDNRQFKLLLLGVRLSLVWLLVLYETSLAEFELKTLSWNWRLAGGESVLAPLRLIAREVAARPEFLTAEENEIEALVREKILDCTALSEAQWAEILECPVDVFRKLRRGLSGRGLVFFEPVQENRFRIYVRSNAEICRDFLVPLMKVGEEFGFFFFERFPPPLVQTIQ